MAGIVGAILSLFFAEGYRALVPSVESQQLAVARSETSDLKNALTSQGNVLRHEVASYQGQIEKERNESADRERRHLVQLSELSAKLDPFIKAATDRYPGLGVEEALERLRGQLSREIQQLRSRASALEDKTSPRRLTSAKMNSIAASLKRNASYEISVTCVMGDTEALQFANDVKRALEMGGWKVSGINQAVFTGPVQGVLIKVGVDPPPSKVMQLFEALKAAGVLSSGILDRKIGTEGFALVIGSKE